MIGWMLYCLIAAAFITVAARATEWIARLAGVSVRWVWSAAMAFVVVLAALAPFRHAKLVELPAMPDRVTLSPDALPFQAGIDAVNRSLPSSSVLAASILWALASLVLLSLIVSVHSRLRRVRHRWPVADMHGSRVRVAPEVGPVVIGFRVPEIVVPHWLLGRTAEEQRLIVTHEAEHVRAKDTLLLGGGVVLVALMPWNPFVWYMFSRLRLAVEVDCDARVLRRGASIESYGSLLIEVASRATPMRFGVAALTSSTSHLHRRIIAMKHIVPKFARLRAGVVGVLGAGALLAACEAKMPTSTEVEAMDVGLAERRLQPLMERASDSIGVYVVDRVEVSKEKALALKPADVASIEVVRGEGHPKKLIIKTRATAEREVPVVAMARKSAGDSSIADVVEVRAAKGTPVLMIDGVRASMDVLRTIDRSAIASVEVLKGKALQAMNVPGVSSEELEGGLIRVTTKK